MTTKPGHAESGADTPKRRRWVLPVLVVSLALNLLFVGLVAGSWWRHGPSGSRDRIITGAVERLMQDLPEDKRGHAAQLLKQHRESVRPVRQQLRDARDAAKEAVLTEPFDEAKVQAALARFREIRTSQHKSMHAMVMDLMKQLTLEERKELLNHIQAGFRSRWRHHRWSSRRGERPPQK